MGTLDYMAPEQAELCGGVDYRADLYAMGATLFRLLCGRPPLAAAPNQSPLEKLRLLANHQPPKLDTLCPEAPPELVKLMSSLLARSPQDRPASAAHVAEELAAFTESADLVTLLKRAEEKEAESPNVIGSDRNRRDCMPAMARSVDAELQDGERGRTGGLTPPRSPRAIGRWIMAAMLPLLVVGGNPDQAGNRQGPARD
jgi:serine/threonine protein kinase